MMLVLEMGRAPIVHEHLEVQLIAQTLHGYDQGHRLLARGGDVNDAELALLDRLSDLSGYVPLGTDFDAYHTGFPCGRHYAFACTWPDRAATRAGTVLTHTLLIPHEVLGNIHDLWHLSRWHRRPDSAADRGLYGTPVAIVLDGASCAPPPVPAPERALSAILLWFGQAERPVLWVEESRPDDVTRFLWGLLWPKARQRFAFCTFALQARYIRRKLFGFLALPPAARGSFHEHARSAAWWRNEELASPALQKQSGQSWVQVILEQGVHATWAMPRFCEDHALPPLDESLFSVFHRFVELEEPARVRLTAARARADLLARLWSELPATHPLLQTTLRQLLARQGDAPLAPRPFWELGDLVERVAVGALVSADAGFASEIAETLAREVRRRLHDATPEAIGGLTTLLTQTRNSLFRKAILDAVQSGFEAMPHNEGTDAKVTVLFLRSVEAHEPLLLKRILSALPVEERSRLALQALEGAPESTRSTFSDFAVTAARQLADPTLAAEVRIAQGRPLDGLRDAAHIFQSVPNARPEMLEKILRRIEPVDRLAWALETAEPALVVWAGERGAEAADELRMPFRELFERCLREVNGASVLRSHLGKLTPQELRRVLNEDGDVTTFVIEAGLRDPSLGASMLVEAAVDSLPEEDLASPGLAALLSAVPTSPITERFVERLLPRWIARIAGGRAAPGETARGFGILPVRQALARLPPGVLFSPSIERVLEADEADALSNLARAIGEYVRGDLSTPAPWIANLLELPLSKASSRSLERAIEDLASIVSNSSERDGLLLLAAQVLSAVRHTGCKTGYRLVEPTFSVLYAKLAEGTLAPGPRGILSRWVHGWDVAKNWRHWLLDQWLNHGWPPASFLRCLGDDEVLFQRIAHRAGKKWRGRQFLRSLREGLANDPALAARWAAHIAWALADPDATGDYD